MNSLLNECGISLGVGDSVLELQVVAAQHCDWTKCHCTVHFKMVNMTLCESCLNRKNFAKKRERQGACWVSVSGPVPTSSVAGTENPEGQQASPQPLFTSGTRPRGGWSQRVGKTGVLGKSTEGGELVLAEPSHPPASVSGGGVCGGPRQFLGLCSSAASGEEVPPSPRISVSRTLCATSSWGECFC